MKVKRILWNIFGILSTTLLLPLTVSAASSYDTSPYVSWSATHEAWTLPVSTEWTKKGTVVNVNGQKAVRALKTGEHYYYADAEGYFPISKWTCVYENHNCIHDTYDENPWYGVTYAEQKCLKPLSSGWLATCANCGRQIDNLFYSSKEAVSSINKLQTETHYYSLCIHNNNMEQGVKIKHQCFKISKNKYTIVYDGNGRSSGSMSDSTFMYDNATEFDGKPITPETKLKKNTYAKKGCIFTGWNTKRDGTGTAYTDEQKIYNLAGKTTYQQVYGRTNDRTEKITLYAQWKKVESTLVINPNGGKYNNSSNSLTLTQNYNSNYNVLKPTGKTGYKVIFNGNGGTTPSAITSSTTFSYWSLNSDFHGTFNNNVYKFDSKTNGSVDTLTANYTTNTITLPTSTREGYNFTGWYYDSNCKKYAGKNGDKFTPTSNGQTLYAGWANLILTSKDNYTANSGKGAVDLSWTQPDNKSKTYKVYQSTDLSTWNLITSATDIGETLTAEKDFSFAKKEQTWTVPYSGTYKISGYGAQGGSYDDTHVGGKGGSMTGTVYLKKGEVVTVVTGGQGGKSGSGGYNGGGSSSGFSPKFAGGGGMTVISTDLKGDIMVIGGGGGATSAYNGKAGGKEEKNVAVRDGEDGSAGGGAGYKGGAAGELITHKHTDSCYESEDLSYTLFNKSTGELSTWMKNYWNKAKGTPGNREVDTPCIGFDGSDYYSPSVNMYGVYMHTKGNAGGNYYLGTYWTQNDAGSYLRRQPYWANTYIPTKDNTQVNVGILLDTWGDKGWFSGEKTYIYVYNQSGKKIYSKTLNEIEAEKDDNKFKFTYNQRNEYISDETVKGTLKIPLPAGTTHIYIVLKAYQEDGASWFQMELTSVKFTGGKNTYTICGYEDNEVISSKAAYGGSSWYNTKYVEDVTQSAGKNEGNGSASIKAKYIGYMEQRSLKEVVAADLAKPNAINTKLITLAPSGDTGYTVTWVKPSDNGSTYYHKVKSFLIDKATLTNNLDSNITKNTLTTGVVGYYYKVDTVADTIMTTANSYTTNTTLTITNSNTTRYLHIAPIDKAGNLGNTVHYKLTANNAPNVLNWPVYTGQVYISGDEGNVYQNSSNGIYYVKADGITPFKMWYNGYIKGTASTDYQIDTALFQVRNTDYKQKITIGIPKSSVLTGTAEYTGNSLYVNFESPNLLYKGMQSKVTRSNSMKQVLVEEDFAANSYYNGKQVKIVPGVSVYNSISKTTITSNDTDDASHGINIILDGEGPVLTGLDALDILNETDNKNDRFNNRINLNIQATDNLSGLAKLQVIIKNNDNYLEQILESTSGKITVNITDNNILYMGDLSVAVIATDKVGNVTTYNQDVQNCTLVTNLNKTREPHGREFKAGDAGTLDITTTGYVDKVVVEFPESLLRYNRNLNKVYEYAYDEELYGRQGNLAADGILHEEYQFFVPIEAANGPYEIKITAYKNGSVVDVLTRTENFTVNGSILDEIRTVIISTS